MPRPIPNTFVNKDTYGVNTDLNRDRLPAIPQDARGTLPDILAGKWEMPTRLCIAALPAAEDADDVARLVIGALLDSSNTSLSSAKILSNATGYADELKVWANLKAYGVGEQTPEVIEGTVASGAAPREVNLADFPVAHLPQWMVDIDFDRADFLHAWKVDQFETAAYAGILAYAIGKQPTPENLEAFNQKRRNAIRQYITTGELTLFVDDSKFLSLEVLGKVHRTFNAIIQDRALVISSIVDRDTALISGKPRIFFIMFRLGSGSSLNPLLIITRFARKYPGFYNEFRDLETEYHAAAHALQRFFDVAEKRRMYLKVIFGSAYIPVDRNDINELLGVAVFALQQSETTLGNYNGGTLSVAHREKLIRILDVAVAVEEEIPEVPIVA